MMDKIERWVEKAGLQNSRKIIMDDIVPDDKKAEYYYWGWFEDIISVSHTLEQAQKSVAGIKIPLPKKHTKNSIKKLVKKQYEVELKQYETGKIERGLTDETCWWYKT